MDLGGLGRLLIGLGAAIALIGAAVLVLPRVPGLRHLGRLPGDLLIQRGSTTIYVPIVTSILLSVLLTLVLNAIFRR